MLRGRTGALFVAAVALAGACGGAVARPGADGGERDAAAIDGAAPDDGPAPLEGGTTDAPAVDGDGPVGGDAPAATDGPPDGGAGPAYRGLYVDDFDGILGDSTRRARLVEWAQRQGFNTMTCYDTQAILSSATLRPLLPPFIKSARVDHGMARVVAVRGLGTDFAAALRPYDDGRADPQERFDGYNLEREWWLAGNGVPFSSYALDLDAMRAAAGGSTPPHTGEEYIGWLTGPNGSATAAAMAAVLVAASDRTLVHDYRVAPDFEYTRSRLEALGQAAAAAGRVHDIVVIFSAESTARGDPNEFMGGYFSAGGGDHTFGEAYDAYAAQWAAASFTGKAALRLIGYQVFAYSQASWARP